MAKAKSAKETTPKAKPVSKADVKMPARAATKAKSTAGKPAKTSTASVPAKSKKIPEVLASFGSAPVSVGNSASAKLKPEWWENGVQFECQGSSKCCVSRGEYGFVYMTMKDRKRMAKVVGLPLAKFTEKFCAKTDGVHHLIDGKGPECVFLVEGKCSVYEGRPDQCRSWPFWPEVMSAKRWKTDVAMFCPGVGKGRIWGKEEIRAIIDEQSKSEYDLVTGN